MKRFEDRTAIVTGGAGGMGASHARGFVAEGANVVIADILEQEGRTLADELGDHALFSRLDVTSDADWAATVGRRRADVRPGLGAGQQRGYRALRTDRGDRAGGLAPGNRRQPDRHVSGDPRGGSLDAQGGGAIVNISSTDGMRGDFGLGAYVASKWGVRGMTKTAALELGRDNIRVNSIHPGPVRTPLAAEPEPAAKIAASVRGWAIPRMAEPDELARLVLFVASEEAGFSTGSEFIADGGELLDPVPG
jgi:3alpha(or 20beta)-hydroxysteroid dehydrogenase